MKDSGGFAAAVLLAGALLLQGVGPLAGDEPEGTSGPATSMAQVLLADGTSLSLSGWSLSYEYQAVPPGASRGLVRPARREARELWLGKEAWPLAGRTLEVRYKAVSAAGGPPEQEAESLVLTASDGKAKALRLELPVRDRLRGDEPKDAVVYPLGLDLRGTSLTGTARQLCLVSFSPFGVCHPADGDRVVRILFVN